MLKFIELIKKQKTKDYLLGKQVLLKKRHTSEKEFSQKITKITKVNKKSFKIESDKNLLFNLDYGNQENIHWSEISFCEVFETLEEINFMIEKLK